MPLATKATYRMQKRRADLVAAPAAKKPRVMAGLRRVAGPTPSIPVEIPVGESVVGRSKRDIDLGILATSVNISNKQAVLNLGADGALRLASHGRNPTYVVIEGVASKVSSSSTVDLHAGDVVVLHASPDFRSRFSASGSQVFAADDMAFEVVGVAERRPAVNAMSFPSTPVQAACSTIREQLRQAAGGRISSVLVCGGRFAVGQLLVSCDAGCASFRWSGQLPQPLEAWALALTAPVTVSPRDIHDVTPSVSTFLGGGGSSSSSSSSSAGTPPLLAADRLRSALKASQRLCVSSLRWTGSALLGNVVPKEALPGGADAAAVAVVVRVEVLAGSCLRVALDGTALPCPWTVAPALAVFRAAVERPADVEDVAAMLATTAALPALARVDIVLEAAFVTSTAGIVARLLSGGGGDDDCKIKVAVSAAAVNALTLADDMSAAPGEMGARDAAAAAESRAERAWELEEGDELEDEDEDEEDEEEEEVEAGAASVGKGPGETRLAPLPLPLRRHKLTSALYCDEGHLFALVDGVAVSVPCETLPGGGGGVAPCIAQGGVRVGGPVSATPTVLLPGGALVLLHALEAAGEAIDLGELRRRLLTLDGAALARLLGELVFGPAASGSGVDKVVPQLVAAAATGAAVEEAKDGDAGGEMDVVEGESHPGPLARRLPPLPAPEPAPLCVFSAVRTRVACVANAFSRHLGLQVQREACTRRDFTPGEDCNCEGCVPEYGRGECPSCRGWDCCGECGVYESDEYLRWDNCECADWKIVAVDRADFSRRAFAPLRVLVTQATELCSAAAPRAVVGCDLLLHLARSLIESPLPNGAAQAFSTALRRLAAAISHCADIASPALAAGLLRFAQSGTSPSGQAKKDSRSEEFFAAVVVGAASAGPAFAPVEATSRLRLLGLAARPNRDALDLILAAAVRAEAAPGSGFTVAEAVEGLVLIALDRPQPMVAATLVECLIAGGHGVAARRCLVKGLAVKGVGATATVDMCTALCCPGTPADEETAVRAAALAALGKMESSRSARAVARHALEAGWLDGGRAGGGAAFAVETTLRLQLLRGGVTLTAAVVDPILAAAARAGTVDATINSLVRLVLDRPREKGTTLASCLSASEHLSTARRCLAAILTAEGVRSAEAVDLCVALCPPGTPAGEENIVRASASAELRKMDAANPREAAVIRHALEADWLDGGDAVAAGIGAALRRQPTSADIADLLVLAAIKAGDTTVAVAQIAAGAGTYQPAGLARLLDRLRDCHAAAAALAVAEHADGPGRGHKSPAGRRCYVRCLRDLGDPARVRAYVLQELQPLTAATPSVAPRPPAHPRWHNGGASAWAAAASGASTVAKAASALRAAVGRAAGAAALEPLCDELRATGNGGDAAMTSETAALLDHVRGVARYRVRRLGEAVVMAAAAPLGPSPRCNSHGRLDLMYKCGHCGPVHAAALWKLASVRVAAALGLVPNAAVGRACTALSLQITTGAGRWRGNYKKFTLAELRAIQGTSNASCGGVPYAELLAGGAIYAARAVGAVPPPRAAAAAATAVANHEVVDLTVDDDGSVRYSI